MQLKFKTLTHETFTIYIQDDNDSSDLTIAQLKSKIEAQQGYAIDSQKLIYSGTTYFVNIFKGKILDNSKRLVDYKINPESFINKSNQPTNKQKTDYNKPNQLNIENTGASNTYAKSTDSTTNNTTNNDSLPQNSDPQSLGNLTLIYLVSGSSFDLAITNLMELGFERPMVIKAMKASYNNPDRAAQYLLNNNIPLETDNEQAEVESTGATAASDNTSLTGTQAAENLFTAAAQQAAANRQNIENTNSNTSNIEDLNSLRNSPIFQQLRQAIQQNPALLQPVLEQIAASNPHAFNIINSNPEAFIRLFSNNEGQDQDQNDNNINMEENNTGANNEENTQYIRVTQEEKEAIDRLVELGFDRATVTQAYFACDKNEELTANYLFEHGHEDD